MNRTYRVIYNHNLGVYQVTSEIARSRVKHQKSTLSALTGLVVLCTTFLSTSTFSPLALAINECGTGTTINCTDTGNPYATGVAYQGAGIKLTLKSGASVDTSTGNPQQSSLNTIGLATRFSGTVTAGALNVTVEEGASIKATQSDVFGINARGTTGTNSFTIVNNGDIQVTGSNSTAIYSYGNGTINITNNATGIINGSGYGIFAQHADSNRTASIINKGDISSGGVGIALTNGAGSTGIQSGTVQQDGTINSVGIGALLTFNVIYDVGTMSLNNTGSITSSGDHGVKFKSLKQGSLVNSGEIVASLGGFQGVDADTLKFTLTNEASGVIKGGIGLRLLKAGGVVTNRGEITGRGGTAIRLTGSTNSVILDTGTVLNGSILSVGSGNTVRLNGTGSTDGSLIDLSTITMAGTTWRLGGTNTATSTALNSTNITSGTLTLTGSLDNPAGGTTIASGAVLQVGNGGAGGTIKGKVNNNGKFRFNQSSDTTYSGVVSSSGGQGDVQINGTGKVTFSGSGSVQRHVDINSGTLAFRQAGTFTATGNFNTRENNTLELGAVANSELKVDGIFKQFADSTLNISFSGKPTIVADRAQLDGHLKLTGSPDTPPTLASEVIDPANDYLLIRTTNGITGDFVSGTSDDLGSEFLFKDGRIVNDGKDYSLGFRMAWMDGLQANGTGNFTLAGGESFNVDIPLVNQTGSFASNWDGSSLNKKGAGTLILSAVNLYTGPTTVSAGKLSLQDSGDISSSSALNLLDASSVLDIQGLTASGTTVNNVEGVTGSSIILGSRSLTAQNSVDTVVAGVLSGEGDLIKTGPAQLTLTGANTYLGQTTVSTGKLSIGNGGTSGSLASSRINIENDAELILNRSDASQYAGILQGTANSLLTKQGAGELKLLGAGSQVGQVNLNQGSLSFEQVGAFNITGNFTAQTGTTTVVDQQGAYINVGGELNQVSGSTVSVFIDAREGVSPSITANTMQIGSNATLNIGGFMADCASPTLCSSSRFLTLIHTGSAGALQGDFTNLTVGNAINPVDYLVLRHRNDGQNYEASVGLTWYADHLNVISSNGSMADGTFTLVDAFERFSVNTVLADQAAANRSTGWDGKSLVKAGQGTLSLAEANTYTGATTIQDGVLNLVDGGSIANSSAVKLESNSSVFDVHWVNATDVQIQNLSGVTGSKMITGSKNLTINNSENTVFAGDFDASTGIFTKQGNGSLTLQGKTPWTTDTYLNAGELILDGSNGEGKLASNIIGQAGSTLSLRNNAQLTGTMDPANLNVDSTSHWAMTGDSLLADLTLAGRIDFAAPVTLPMTVGHTLTMNNLNGQNGTIALYTFKGSDLSASDKIVIDGGAATGNTQLEIKSGEGEGEQTQVGIRVVETKNGATTTSDAFSLSPTSDGYRAGVGSLVAGAFDYRLTRGGNGGIADDWYLVSASNLPPNGEEGGDEPEYRPEVGGYQGNQQAVRYLFTHTLRERQAQHVANIDGSDREIWLRAVTTGSSQRGSRGLNVDDHSQIVQLGGDLFHGITAAGGQVQLGVMGGVGSSKVDAHNSERTAKSSMDAYSLGVYGTWYQLADRQLGTYVDTWALYGRQNNHVTGEGLAEESYRSKTFQASIESGYGVKWGQINGQPLYVTPQAQMIVNHYGMNDHTEENGTVISSGGSMIDGRVGVRIHNTQPVDTGTVQFFAELNEWYHSGDAELRLDGQSIKRLTPKYSTELKVGVQGNLTQQLSVWSQVGFIQGQRSYQAYSGQLGVRYTW